MRLVVAHSSPLRYLVLIGQIELLPRLFEKILIPSVLSDEPRHPSAPEAVRDWMTSMPDWLEISVVSAGDDPSLSVLDEGEKAAITFGTTNFRAREELFDALLKKHEQREPESAT